MAGADVAVLWTNDDGSGTVSDRFSSGYSEPSVDASQDWAMLEVPIINGDRTTFRLERRRSTGDQDDTDISNSVRRNYWTLIVVGVLDICGEFVKAGNE